MAYTDYILIAIMAAVILTGFAGAMLLAHHRPRLSLPARPRLPNLPSLALPSLPRLQLRLPRRRGPLSARTPKAAPAPPSARDWAWFLGRVDEAQKDRSINLLHPGRLVKLTPPVIRALLRHYRRWLDMRGIPVKRMALVKALFAPPLTYREAFLRVLAIERNDEVEPYIPTGVVEHWQPKAAWADQPDKLRSVGGASPLSSRDAYVWLALAPGQLIGDMILMSQFHDLSNDDFRMEDIMHVERRALDREVQSTGFLAADVDDLEQEQPNPILELLPHAAGILLPVITGFIYIASR